MSRRTQYCRKRKFGECPSELFNASRSGSLDTVKQRLAAGDDPNYSWVTCDDPDCECIEDELRDGGSTVLEVAAYRGFLEIVNELLKAGAKPDGPTDCLPTTPLSLAIGMRHGAVAAALLAAGAEPKRVAMDPVGRYGTAADHARRAGLDVFIH